MEQDNYCWILLWGDNCVGQSGITVWKNLPVVEELELDDLDDLQGLFQAEAFCDFMMCRSFPVQGGCVGKGNMFQPPLLFSVCFQRNTKSFPRLPCERSG